MRYTPEDILAKYPSNPFWAIQQIEDSLTSKKQLHRPEVLYFCAMLKGCAEGLAEDITQLDMFEPEEDGADDYLISHEYHKFCSGLGLCPQLTRKLVFFDAEVQRLFNTL